MRAKAQKAEPAERACDDGCNTAKYTLVNGDEVSRLCQPAFEQEIRDMIDCNTSLYLEIEELPDGTLQVRLT